MTETYRIPIHNNLCLTIQKVKNGPLGYGIHDIKDTYSVEFPTKCETLIADGYLTETEVKDILSALKKLTA